MNSPIIKYLRNHLYITLGSIFIGIIFYYYTPNINIVNLIEKFSELSNKYDTSQAIIELLNEKNNEIIFFINLIKISLSVIIVLILFTISFFYYTQKEFQDEIKLLKKETKENISDLSSEIFGIERVLVQHFDDYRVFIEYSRLQGSIIHHNFIEALKYDIDKINDLKKDEIFKSTVLLKETYLDSINNNKDLALYIQALKNSVQRGVKIQRIFIIKNIKLLTKMQKEHLRDLKNACIDVKIVEESNLHEIDNLYRELSKNFIIINNREVAFAYPFYGDFRFAVNIIANEDREAKKYFDYYNIFFDQLYQKSSNLENKK